MVVSGTAQKSAIVLDKDYEKNLAAAKEAKEREEAEKKEEAERIKAAARQNKDVERQIQDEEQNNASRPTEAEEQYRAYKQNTANRQNNENTRQSRSYGSAGCGLGSMIYGNQPGIAQLYAASTNTITYSNQPLGITSGTSNCATGSTAYTKQEQEIFAAVNKTVLEQEMAAGGGEKLTAFSELFGCPIDQSKSFGTMIKEEYGELSKYTEDPTSLVQAIQQSITKNKELSVSCVI